MLGFMRMLVMMYDGKMALTMVIATVFTRK